MLTGVCTDLDIKEALLCYELKRLQKSVQHVENPTPANNHFKIAHRSQS